MKDYDIEGMFASLAMECFDAARLIKILQNSISDNVPAASLSLDMVVLLQSCDGLSQDLSDIGVVFRAIEGKRAKGGWQIFLGDSALNQLSQASFGRRPTFERRLSEFKDTEIFGDGDLN